MNSLGHIFFVPVNGDIMLDMVNYFDEEAITLTSHNARPWELSISCHNALGMAKPGYIVHFNLQKH